MERKMKLMVVDDEQVVLDSVNKILKNENLDISGILSAPEALSIIRSDPPDIILTDLMMPEIDGLQLMKEVTQFAPNIPIIMITGYATINTALQATQLGAFDYVAKPFTRAELKAVVTRAMELVRSNAANNSTEAAKDNNTADNIKPIKHAGDNVWMMVEESGLVLLGIERPFLTTIGRIQTIVLPSVGDELRQGSGYVQFFTSELRSHTLLSPFSGVVTEINEKMRQNPDIIIEDPYGAGWLIRLKPTRFDIEVIELGL
jgi:CheY-like chemotaxis protein/glycine cleavage system H lipoate-binding protein